jgi:hypothetical protein
MQTVSLVLENRIRRKVKPTQSLSISLLGRHDTQALQRLTKPHFFSAILVGVGY